MTKVIKLWKIELYRFWRNFGIWLFMVLMVSIILLLASDDTSMLLGDNSIVGIVTSTMKIANLLIVLMVSATVSIYIGKEFKQKTICYEIMSGYAIWKGSLIRTFTCGIMNAIMLQCGIFVYIKIIGRGEQIYSWERYILMFIIICHICTSITLYIMLFREGTTGGCLAFIRFTLLSVAGLFMAEIFFPQPICDIYKALSPMSQWNVVINVEYMIPARYMVGIPLSFLLEYFILIAAIGFLSKRMDF